VKVRTHSQEVGVKEINSVREGERKFIVSVSEKPVDNLANRAVIKELARYFHVSRSTIKLISGKNYKEKVFEINKIL